MGPNALLGFSDDSFRNHSSIGYYIHGLQHLQHSSSFDQFTTVASSILLCHAACDTRKAGRAKRRPALGVTYNNGCQLGMRYSPDIRPPPIHDHNSRCSQKEFVVFPSHASSNQPARRFQPLEVDSSIVISHNSVNPCFFDPTSEIHALIRGELIFKFQLRLIYLQSRRLTKNANLRNTEEAHGEGFLRIKYCEISIHAGADHSFRLLETCNLCCSFCHP